MILNGLITNWHDLCMTQERRLSCWWLTPPRTSTVSIYRASVIEVSPTATKKNKAAAICSKDTEVFPAVPPEYRAAYFFRMRDPWTHPQHSSIWLVPHQPSIWRPWKTQQSPFSTFEWRVSTQQPKNSCIYAFKTSFGVIQVDISKQLFT